MENKKINKLLEIQDLMVKFLSEKKKDDPTDVYQTRATMIDEFYVWLIEKYK